MKNLVFSPQLILVNCFICLALLISSCGDDEPKADPVPGCIDSQAENFNSAANEDDGSCTYAKTKFFGDYLGTFSCRAEILIGVLDSDSLYFSIKEPVSDVDMTKVVLALSIDGLPVDLDATVQGTTLTVDDTFDNFAIPEFPNPLDTTMKLTLIANVTGQGTAELSDNDTHIEGELILDMVAVDGSFTIRDTCALVGNKL